MTSSYDVIIWRHHKVMSPKTWPQFQAKITPEYEILAGNDYSTTERACNELSGNILKLYFFSNLGVKSTPKNRKNQEKKKHEFVNHL